jgi:hypothetical protein
MTKYFCGISRDNGIGWNVSGDDATGTYDGVLSDA